MARIIRYVKCKDTFSIGQYSWTGNKYYAVIERNDVCFLTSDKGEMVYSYGSETVDLLETMLDWSVGYGENIYKIVATYEKDEYIEEVYEYTYAVFGDNPFVICADGTKEPIFDINQCITVRDKKLHKEIWCLNNSDIPVFREVLRSAMESDLEALQRYVESGLNAIRNGAVVTRYYKE